MRIFFVQWSFTRNCGTSKFIDHKIKYNLKWKYWKKMKIRNGKWKANFDVEFCIKSIQMNIHIDIKLCNKKKFKYAIISWVLFLLWMFVIYRNLVFNIFSLKKPVDRERNRKSGKLICFDRISNYFQQFFLFAYVLNERGIHLLICWTWRQMRKVKMKII